MIQTRHVVPADAEAWLAMRSDLWPEGYTEEHALEIRRFFAGELQMPLAVLVAEDSNGTICGFAELSIRNYAEDCLTDRVAYLEGWYVTKKMRRRGVGRALMRAAEEWGVAQGCTEFASDALLNNMTSAAAHLALGFTETVQIRCFRKDLPAGESTHETVA
jgi:aminoglycoside 6'-N-acetyltransferase I